MPRPAGPPPSCRRGAARCVFDEDELTPAKSSKSLTAAGNRLPSPLSSPVPVASDVHAPILLPPPPGSRKGLVEAFRPYAIISRLVGVLLLTAAVLKLLAVGGAPVQAAGFFETAAGQLALVILETGLGVWLVSGHWPLGSWLVSLLLFGVFAAVTFRQGWAGQSSCGCLGSVAVNPWYTFTLDLVVLSALLLGRPDRRPLGQYGRSDLRRGALHALASTAAVGFFLAALALAGSW